MSKDVYWIDDPDRKRKSAGGPEVAPRSGRPRRRRRLWPWFLGLLLAFAAACYLLRHPILVGVARFLDVTETVQPADYALILSGAPDVRPFYAAALYRAGLAGAVLVTRPEPTPDVLAGVEPPQYELTQQVLLAEGVFPIDVVVLPGEETSTLDEIRSLKAFLIDRPTAQVVVVTSGYHTRRTRLVVRRTLGPAAGRVRVLGVPSDSFRDDDWWRSKRGLRAVVGEVLKIPYYWLVY